MFKNIIFQFYFPFSEKDYVYQNEKVTGKYNNERFRYTETKETQMGWKKECKIKIVKLCKRVLGNITLYIIYTVEILHYCGKPYAESEQWANRPVTNKRQNKQEAVHKITTKHSL